MKVKWEKAKKAEFPILAWRTYVSTLPVLESRQKPTKRESVPLQKGVDVGEVESVLDDVMATTKRVNYPIRLPYTYEMLERRHENGRDLPTFVKLDQD